MKPVLILQNDPHEGAGQLATLLSKRGIQQRTSHGYDANYAALKADLFSGLVILGGAQSAYEVGRYGYLADEMRLCEDFMRAEKPIAGFCLGAQILARTLGGAVLLSGCAGSSNVTPPKSAYSVRAIFDSAAFVLPGLDVKVAGVKVGAVDGVELTDDNQAAVTFTITDAGFKDFRKDATCTIRPQALIGERYIECELTQPRPDGGVAPGPSDEGGFDEFEEFWASWRDRSSTLAIKAATSDSR